ncbi:MAG: site-specific integrase [Gammaproteobacteria bacterium]|nr:site-specific integrase [Gammaproteobacteria bacterium]
MAAYRKRGKKWRVEVCIDGARRSATFDTKTACRDWAVEQELNGVDAGTGAHSMLAALKRYAKEVSPTKKGARWEAIRLHKLEKEIQFIALPMNKIETSDIAKWRDAALRKVASGTVKREMNLLRSVFEIARKEWGWLEVNPMKGVAAPTTPKHRFRRVLPDEIETMLKQLGYVEGQPPENKKQVTAYAWLIAIETAMRAGELLSLDSDKVFPEKRFVSLIDTKNSDRRDVPLTSRAVELFQRLPDHRLDISSGVLSSTFRKARIETGIKDMTFHDSRHEALTRLAQKLHVLDLARMVGHRDPKSLMIYYNPSAEEIAAKLD